MPTNYATGWDMDAELAEKWQAYQIMIEAALEDALPPREDCPHVLWEAMSYSLTAGGKRLRPVLVLMACEACGGEATAALPAALAIEMVHTYSLIHDDLPAMDNDDFRRGRPTSHKQFGEANAILAGDALLTRAFEVIGEGVHPASIAAACCVDLARGAGAQGMVGGQVLDLEAEQESNDRDQQRAIELLDNIHRCKTAALIACAASLGARVAGADERTRKLLFQYGENIGLVFQIADDLLDVTSDRDTMGKGVGKDADRGKLTYPGLLGIEASRAIARRVTEEACECVRPLGPSAAPLIGLAEFVLRRDH